MHNDVTATALLAHHGHARCTLTVACDLADYADRLTEDGRRARSLGQLAEGAVCDATIATGDAALDQRLTEDGFGDDLDAVEAAMAEALATALRDYGWDVANAREYRAEIGRVA